MRSRQKGMQSCLLEILEILEKSLVEFFISTSTSFLAVWHIFSSGLDAEASWIDYILFPVSRSMLCP